MPRKSQGTVSLHTGNGDTRINFAPDGNYTVRHRDDSFAVFISDDNRAILKKINDADAGVPIIAYGHLAGLPTEKAFTLVGVQSAAIRGSKVEVEVALGTGDSLILTGITVPAK